MVRALLVTHPVSYAGFRSDGYIIAQICPKPMSPQDVCDLTRRQMDFRMWVFGVGWTTTLSTHVSGKLKYALGIVNAEGKVLTTCSAL